MWLGTAQTPGYWEWLGRADLAEALTDVGVKFKNSGLYGVVAVLLFLAALGLGAGGRRTAALALVAATLGCAAGWYGSYVGYSKVVAVVGASGRAPSPADMDIAAQNMAFLPVASTLAFVLALGWTLLMGVVRTNRSET